MLFDAPTAEEFSLVFDAWANSFKKSPYAGCIPNRLWDDVSRAGISEILDRGARVVVACMPLPDGRRRVMGYSVSEPDKHVLHWLYVKRDYRGTGVGTALLRETCQDSFGWSYTHRTKAADNFLRRASSSYSGPRFVWDPVPARVLSR
jgi:GNAT superfamily N-acetyltransferase